MDAGVASYAEAVGRGLRVVGCAIFAAGFGCAALLAIAAAAAWGLIQILG